MQTQPNDLGRCVGVALISFIRNLVHHSPSNLHNCLSIRYKLYMKMHGDVVVPFKQLVRSVEFSFDGIEGLKNCHGHATWYLVRVVVEAIHGGVLPMISSCFVVCAVASVVADLLVARGKLR